MPDIGPLDPVNQVPAQLPVSSGSPPIIPAGGDPALYAGTKAPQWCLVTQGMAGQLVNAGAKSGSLIWMMLTEPIWTTISKLAKSASTPSALVTVVKGNSALDVYNMEQAGAVCYTTAAAAKTAAATQNAADGPQTPNPLAGLSAIGDFFSRLTDKNTWIRFGEVAAGLILLGIGVNALFKGDPMKAVTNLAGKAAPLAMA